MIPIPTDAELILETERLLLSAVCAADAASLFDLLKEPSLYSFTGGTPPSGLDGLTKRIRAWEKKQSPAGEELWLNWTLRLRSDGRVVGYVQASVSRDDAQLAWVIGLSFQGHGYATEASLKIARWLRDRLGINELRANIHPKHVASQEVAKRVGLQPTTELTQEGEEVWTSSSIAD
jgi:RimJ/RimL family protein N-acetyltransferase